MLAKQSELARKAIAVGRENHWRFQVIDRDEIPKIPILKSELLFEPVDKYSIPKDGRERIRAIEFANIRTQGYMIAHEAPRILTAPKPKPKPVPIPKPMPKPQVEIDLSGALKAVTGLLVAGFTGVMGLVSLLGFMVLLLDPAVIVVLEDGSWIKVMTWYE